MDKYTPHVATLKQKLAASAQDFGEIQEYFFDHLAEDRKFLRSCKPCKDKDLEMILGRLIEQHLGPDAELTHPMLVCAKRYGLVHGSMLIGGMLATVLYFQSMGMGLLAISKSLESGAMTYVRFSRHDVPEGTDATPVAGGSSVH